MAASGWSLGLLLLSCSPAFSAGERASRNSYKATAESWKCFVSLENLPCKYLKISNLGAPKVEDLTYFALMKMQERMKLQLRRQAQA